MHNHGDKIVLLLATGHPTGSTITKKGLPFESILKLRGIRTFNIATGLKIRQEKPRVPVLLSHNEWTTSHVLHLNDNNDKLA